MSFVDERVSISTSEFKRQVHEKLPGIRTFHHNGPLAQSVFNDIVEAQVVKTKSNVDGIKILSRHYDVGSDSEIFKVRIFLKD